MRCCFQNCTNDTRRTSRNRGITFYAFPKEQSLRAEWLEALGLTHCEPGDRSTVCSEHFHKDDFHTKNGLRRIKNGAVPLGIYDSVEELDAPALTRVCRLCLAVDTRMFDINEEKLEFAYEQILGVCLLDEDKLPQKVCWECAHRLLAATGFKTRALRCQELLQTVVEPHRHITLRDVRWLARANAHLKTTLVVKHFDTDDYDLYIEDNRDVIEEAGGVSEREDVEDAGEGDDATEDKSEEELQEEIESNGVRDETSNDIFFVEYPDFDDSDDTAGSEVREDVTTENGTTKKRKLKQGEKPKEKKVARRREVDESPANPNEKYSSCGVKRRRTAAVVDEALFTVTPLTLEQQLAEVARRRHQPAYTGAPHRCHVCYRGFVNRERLDAHSERHSELAGAHECVICRTRFRAGRVLRKHMTTQHSLQYTCNTCGFRTRSKGVAIQHEKWHAGTRYQCPHCPSEFDKVTTYMGHLRIKHVSDCVCELCGFAFVSELGIKVHKKKKHRTVLKPVLKGPYCEVCDVRFVSQEAHDRHLRLSSKHSHEGDPNRIRNDSQAPITPGRRPERRTRIHPRKPGEPRAPPAPRGPFTCEQCGLQLRDLRRYAYHFRRAHPDKNRTKYPAVSSPYMCEQCGQIYPTMSNLKDHMWVHTGEKRFKCEQCHKSFTKKSTLVFHMHEHSGSRPTFECPLCGKHFTFISNYRRHMFIHTGQKPHKCDSCGKRFTTTSEHRAHVDHVHLKKPWPKRVRARRTRAD